MQYTNSSLFSLQGKVQNNLQKLHWKHSKIPEENMNKVTGIWNNVAKETDQEEIKKGMIKSD